MENQESRIRKPSLIFDACRLMADGFRCNCRSSALCYNREWGVTMTKRVVFDTNIWISDLLWRGKPHQCLLLARSQVVQHKHRMCPDSGR